MTEELIDLSQQLRARGMRPQADELVDIAEDVRRAEHWSRADQVVPARRPTQPPRLQVVGGTCA